MSIAVSRSPAGYFSPATVPHRDRRATAERRIHLEGKPLIEPEPESESSWGRHALLAGFLGVVLGSMGVMAVLAQQAASSPAGQTANLAMAQQPVAAAVAAARFDTTPAASPVSAFPAITATTDASTVEAVPGAESYSEDAAGVPGATYREPPVVQTGASRLAATVAR